MLRWCPAHRRYEKNPPGRLLCASAWRYLYALEREAEYEGRIPLIEIVDILSDIRDFFVDRRKQQADIRLRDKPVKPALRPRPTPPEPWHPEGSGTGGVALP